jgi:hypothetical protein
MNKEKIIKVFVEMAIVIIASFCFAFLSGYWLKFWVFMYLIGTFQQVNKIKF